MIIFLQLPPATSVSVTEMYRLYYITKTLSSQRTTEYGNKVIVSPHLIRVWSTNKTHKSPLLQDIKE